VRARHPPATSIFFIPIIASNARFASSPPAASASVSTRGAICQETLPAAIADLAYHNKAVVYDLLFRASAETVLTIAADSNHFGTGWSLMGRFGLTSLGHGAFTGIGAYTVVLLWNFAGLTPWLGVPAGVVLAVAVALLVGYPCFRLRITGHYFALLTLALTEFVRLCIVGLRDYTGGSLGTQPTR
jgi:ABC-type branched-subunit amino acid transport system permease subunit